MDPKTNLDQFNEFREKMNDIILDEAPLEIKRFWSLDNQMYKDGALDPKTKELCALVGSMVLRCDDCITYHLSQLIDLGTTDEELWESMGIGLLIGGSVVMPHMRRAVATIKEIRGGRI